MVLVEKLQFHLELPSFTIQREKFRQRVGVKLFLDQRNVFLRGSPIGDGHGHRFNSNVHRLTLGVLLRDDFLLEVLPHRGLKGNRNFRKGNHFEIAALPRHDGIHPHHHDVGTGLTMWAGESLNGGFVGERTDSGREHRLPEKIGVGEEKIPQLFGWVVKQGQEIAINQGGDFPINGLHQFGVEKGFLHRRRVGIEIVSLVVVGKIVDQIFGTKKGHYFHSFDGNSFDGNHVKIIPVHRHGQ